MSNIDLSLELQQNHSTKQMVVAVKFCGIQVMSWHEIGTSAGVAPVFGSAAQFGQDQWKVFGHSGAWENAWLDAERNPGMEVSLADLHEVSKAAVYAMFGRAFDLQVVEAEFGYDVTLDGEVVLEWHDPLETGEFICFDAASDNMFMMFTQSRHGFVPWNDGEHGYDEDTYEPRSIPQVSMFAYRALLLSQGDAA